MTSPPATPAEVVSQMYAALRDRDIEQLVSVLHPEARVVLAAGMPLDLGGAHAGRDAVLRMWRRLSTSFDVLPQPLHVHEIDHREVIVRGTYVGHHRETGTSISAAFVHILTISDTTVRTLDQVTDTHAWRLAMPRRPRAAAS